MIKRLASLLAVALSLTACKGGGGGGSPLPPPVSISGWSQMYGNVSVNSSTGSFSFGEPHYIVQPAPRLQVGQTITMVFSVDSADIHPVDMSMNQPGDVARVGLYMQQRGDNLTCEGDFQHYRIWFSNRVAITTPGSYTITATLDPSGWTDCYGQHLDPGRYASFLANVQWVGFTFGGSDAGHGVAGHANFTLISYTIDGVPSKSKKKKKLRK